MGSLVSVRDGLMRGDLRALYIGWLATLRSHGWDDEDEVEGEDDDEELSRPSLRAWRGSRRR